MAKNSKNGAPELVNPYTLEFQLDHYGEHYVNQMFGYDKTQNGDALNMWEWDRLQTLNQNSTDWFAQKQLLEYMNYYNSPEQQAIRMREGGLNPDWGGVSSNQSASMETPNRTMPAVSEEFSTIYDSVMQALSVGSQIAGMAGGLSVLPGKITAQNLANLVADYGFAGKVFADYGSGGIESVMDSLGMSKRQKSMAREMYRSLPHQSEYLKGVLDYNESVKRYYMDQGAGFHGSLSVASDTADMFRKMGSILAEADSKIAKVRSKKADVDSLSLDKQGQYLTEYDPVLHGQAVNFGNESILNNKEIEAITSETEKELIKSLKEDGGILSSIILFLYPLLKQAISSGSNSFMSGLGHSPFTPDVIYK